MATLYVQNFPRDLYEALRKRAKSRNRSIAAEVISLIAQNVPTDKELRKRRTLYRRLARLRALPSPQPGPFPSTVEMIREDRSR
jgi:plasmid stability protein